MNDVFIIHRGLNYISWTQLLLRPEFFSSLRYFVCRILEWFVIQPTDKCFKTSPHNNFWSEFCSHCDLNSMVSWLLLLWFGGVIFCMFKARKSPSTKVGPNSSHRCCHPPITLSSEGKNYCTFCKGMSKIPVYFEEHQLAQNVFWFWTFAPFLEKTINIV